MDRIGTDESGKGDYYGPLVVAAVYVGKGDDRKLRNMGVRDGKKLRDDRVLSLERKIKDGFEHDVVRISPGKYNALYDKLGNLNVMLAWAHARAIENLLPRVICDMVVSDQFGDERFLEERLMDEGRKVRLVQRPRAESDLAVAAASILARAAYLRFLKGMRMKYGVIFPKGAVEVYEAGKTFIELYGLARLGEVAKLHFKTTEKIKENLKQL
ncbi:MAG: ribonuclease HIII [Candidatus Altiarchaeales archaeon]|nr:ribonuclease HIII [Candidatus Altiarchaeales archaeon]MBD3415913.1 ribonuclease HIII [Candidatus Altiarchaeales archaeon]